MNQTTCLICQRSGSGWSVREIRRFDGLVTGSKIMREGRVDPTHQKVGLKKWIQANGYEDDPLLISSIYLYTWPAPGEWCQLYWECSTPEVSHRLRERLTSSDFDGEYLLDRKLSDLSKDEIYHYQKTLIDA